MRNNDSLVCLINTDVSLDFKNIQGDQNFYINKDGKLVLGFNKYEAAPGYIQMVKFTIPSDVSQALLSETAITYF